MKPRAQPRRAARRGASARRTGGCRRRCRPCSTPTRRCPPSRSAATIALIGSVEKYAAGAPATTGWSIGWQPALSQMRAVVDVDGDALGRDLGAAAGLADADHQLRLQLVDGRIQLVAARGRTRRRCAARTARASPAEAPAVERAHRLPRRVDGLAVEGLEAGQQHVHVSRAVASRAHLDALGRQPLADAPRKGQRVRAVAVQAHGLRVDRDHAAVDGASPGGRAPATGSAPATASSSSISAPGWLRGTRLPSAW